MHAPFYYHNFVCSTMHPRLLIKMVKNHFKEDFTGVFKHLSASGGNPVEDDMRSLLFGDYLVPDAVSRLECVVYMCYVCIVGGQAVSRGHLIG